MRTLPALLLALVACGRGQDSRPPHHEPTDDTATDTDGHEEPPETETACGDGLDDDGDGLTDCLDPDCVLTPACPEDCTNGIDDDADGAVDCDDSDCVGPFCPEVCDDFHDNDGDGLVDCDDPDCVTEACPEDCEDGFDNDADGLADCEDGDCYWFEHCREVCDDGIDNDYDGLTDCEDGDCYGSDPCREDCSLDGDEDDDGLADCEDPDCWHGCVVASRVREGAHVWWLVEWYLGRGSATSIDGTIWLQPRRESKDPSVAVPCTWHADYAHFGFRVSHVHHYTLAWVTRTGFVLSSACPLPVGMSACLPTPLPRWGHVDGWVSTYWPPETVESWYLGPMVTLGTYHYSGSMRAGHWSIAPVETGNTFKTHFPP